MHSNTATKLQIIMKTNLLTEKVVKEIRGNLKLKTGLMLHHGIGEFTLLQRWLKDDQRLLTTAKSLEIIREETGLSDEEILVQETATK